MDTRRLLSKQQEQEVEELLLLLQKSEAPSRTADKLRMYFENNDLLFCGMPSYVGHPPVIFYLVESSRGLCLLDEALLQNVTADALNYIHQNGGSTLSRIVRSGLDRLISYPCVAEKVDPELFNRKFQSADQSLASYSLRHHPSALFKCEDIYAQKIDDVSFEQGFAALLERKDGFSLLMQSSAFQARITADLLNAHAETILDSVQGRKWLAENPGICELLTAESVCHSLGLLVREGEDLFIAVPSLADKIDRKQLNDVREYSYVRLAHHLLTTEQGQRALNANPALVAKINAATLNQRKGRIGHTKFFHQVLSPQQREKVRVDEVWGHIVYDIVSTEHGREFLIQNDVIRKMITDDSLSCKFNYGRYKGESVNKLLKKPEYAELKKCFERDRQERALFQEDLLYPDDDFCDSSVMQLREKPRVSILKLFSRKPKATTPYTGKDDEDVVAYPTI